MKTVMKKKQVLGLTSVCHNLANYTLLISDDIKQRKFCTSAKTKKNFAFMKETFLILNLYKSSEDPCVLLE